MTDVRVLVTGSRDWTDVPAVETALRQALREHAGDGQRVVVVHGGARGLDRIAASVALRWGHPVEVHRADWVTHGRAAGHRRNAEMVAAGAAVCLAFPLGESRGTRGCMALAVRAGIPVVDCSPVPG